MIAGGNHSMVKKPRTQKILANIIHRSTRLRGRRLRRSGRLLGDPYRACAIHEMLAKIQRCGRLRASPTECGGKRKLQQPTGYTPSVSPFGLTAPPEVEPRVLRTGERRAGVSKQSRLVKFQTPQSCRRRFLPGRHSGHNGTGRCPAAPAPSPGDSDRQCPAPR